MTMPMLTMIGELQRRQNELCKILKAKDKQIEDFKMQGVKNTRSKYLFLKDICTINKNSLF